MRVTVRPRDLLQPLRKAGDGRRKSRAAGRSDPLPLSCPTTQARPCLLIPVISVSLLPSVLHSTGTLLSPLPRSTAPLARVRSAWRIEYSRGLRSLIHPVRNAPAVRDAQALR